MAKVSFVTGDGEEKSFRLFSHRPLRIGRDPSNDVVLRDAKVSRAHAEIVFERGFFVLHDLGSANGSYVNGISVRVAPLTDGAELKLGNTRGVFSEELAEPPSATVAARIDTLPAGADAAADAGATAPQEKARPDDVDEVYMTSADEEPHRAFDRRAPLVVTADASRQRNATVEVAAPSTMPMPLPAPARRKSDTPEAEGRLLRERFIISAAAPHATTMTVATESNEPLLWVRRHVTLITFVAHLLTGVVAASGIAATLFLAFQRSFVAAVTAVALTFIFGAIIISLSPRRFLHAFSDEQCSERFLTVWQETRLPFPRSRFSARSGNGTVVATFEKLNLNPFGRRKWWIRDAAGTAHIGYAIEDSLALALARKLLGNFISALRPDYTIVVGVRRCGFIDRTGAREGRLLLDLSDDPGRTMNRQTAVALALLIACIEK